MIWNVPGHGAPGMSVTSLVERILSLDDRQRCMMGKAMVMSNPDIEGDLKRNMDLLGVGNVLRDGMCALSASGRRRSRYVPGWTAPSMPGTTTVQG